MLLLRLTLPELLRYVPDIYCIASTAAKVVSALLVETNVVLLYSIGLTRLSTSDGPVVFVHSMYDFRFLSHRPHRLGSGPLEP